MEIRIPNEWGYTIFSSIKGSHVSFRTEKADIELITNPVFGRMLFIDKVLQSSEADEAAYHGTLSRLVNKHYLPITGLHYLIAGGAEGAMARDLLKYHPKKITMVDWDEQLVNYMKEENWHKGAFSDSRLSIIHEDILDFLDKDRIYDGIVLDLLDPSTEDVPWLYSVILKARKCLRTGSSLVANIGGDKAIAATLCTKLREFSPVVEVLAASDVPSFQGDWYFLCLRK
jgi:spermidine synthase